VLALLICTNDLRPGLYPAGKLLQDPLGRHASALPFAGAIVQWIAKQPDRGYNLQGPPIGRNRNYNAKGVHAPG